MPYGEVRNLSLGLAGYEPRTRRVRAQYIDTRLIAKPMARAPYSGNAWPGLQEIKATSRNMGERETTRLEISHAENRTAIVEVEIERTPRVWPLLGPIRMQG